MAGVRSFALLGVCAIGLAGLKALDVVDGVQTVSLFEAPAFAAAAKDEPKPEPAPTAQPIEADEPKGSSAPATDACPSVSLATRAGLTHREIEVLKTLGDRRRDLDAREEALTTRALVLEQAEARIEARVEALKTLQNDIETLIGTLDDEEEAEIARLTKMYEQMKAKSAAEIFVALDPGVRLQVASRMKEQPLSAIMAAMPGVEAAELTVALATRHDGREAFEEALAAARE